MINWERSVLVIIFWKFNEFKKSLMKKLRLGKRPIPRPSYGDDPLWLTRSWPSNVHRLCAINDVKTGRLGHSIARSRACLRPLEIERRARLFCCYGCISQFWMGQSAHDYGTTFRDAFKSVLGSDASLALIYDVAHNIGKRERHTVDGTEYDLLVHRKGATRSFGPRPEMPAKYQPVGQPVLIPGTMGTASYVLAGNNESMEKSFGSSCHGAGRRMSRTKAKQIVRGSTLREKLEHEGIIIRCESDIGLAKRLLLLIKMSITLSMLSMGLIWRKKLHA